MKKLLPSWIWVTALFLGTHLISLVKLPVFADEAIYIRWAQLIQDDAARYFFFSMSDGKPPLYMWLLSVVLRWFPDPLFAARFLSVLIGLASVFVFRALVSQFTKDRFAVLAVTLFGTFLPYWFFYHRMGLMDGLLTLFISLAFLFAIRLSLKFKLVDVLLLGFSFGAAMMTKTPALFAIPIIAITPIYFWLNSSKRSLKSLLNLLVPVAIGGFIGTLLFLLLRISPLFGSLFSRSTDFTFTIKDLLAGEWHYVLFESFKRNLGWIAFYFTPELMLISILGLYFKKIRLHVSYLLLCALIFFAPLTLFGRVLWPRYFLPCVIFLTIAAAVSVSEMLKHKLLKYVAILLLLIVAGRAFYNLGTACFAPEKMPFVHEDNLQYLNEWSAGYGNIEVRNFIQMWQKQLPSDGSKKIIVLTEGSFGTLPDGLLMYFHDSKLAQNLEIHGIGVGVTQIPEQYIRQASKNFVYYVVNSHRLRIENQNTINKLFEVKRPDGPSLLFFQVMP